MGTVAHELPFAIGIGVAKLDAFDEYPMAVLAAMNGEQVINPRIARLLHPAPQRRPFLFFEMPEAVLQSHFPAELCCGRGDFHGAGALDGGSVGNAAEAVNLAFDAADRKAGQCGQNVGTAERRAAGVVLDLVEAGRPNGLAEGNACESIC